MTSSGQTDLGKALRALRSHARLTQEDLAAQAGLDAPYISRVENGSLDIRWSTLTQLLDALGADLRELQEMIDRQHAASSDGPSAA